MKKLLFSVIAFALITTSCNKYKDDFKALNARIDALAAQITGVNTLVAGIQASQLTLAQLTAATAGIAPIQAGLTALTATVNGIQTTLATVAAGTLTNTGLLNTLTATIAANQTATLAAIAGINTNLAAAIVSINANTNTAVAAAQAALAAAITAAQNNINAATVAAIAASQAALEAAITAAAAGTNALINSLSLDLDNAVAQLQSDIADAVAAINLNTNDQSAIIQNLINALSAQLAVAAAQIQTLLNSNNIFLGDLVITNEAELVFAEGLGAKVRVITGNLTINTTLFDAGQMTRLKQVTNGDQVAPLTAYIGSVVGSVVLGGGNVIDLSQLVSIGGPVGNLTVSGASHNLSKLLSVKGNYVATSNPVDDALITVGGAMTISYGGGYSYPNLTTVGTPAGASVLTASSANLPTVFNFPVLTTNNVLNDGVNANGVLSYGFVTSVNIGASKTLTSLTAPASSIILGETAYTGPLTIVTGVVSTIDLSKMVSAVGAISISTATSASSTVDFSNFTGNGANTITVTGPRVLTMPKYLGALAGQLLMSTTVQTANLALYRGPNDLGNLTVLQNLTVGDLRNTLGTGGATVAGTLITATVTGSTYGANVNFTGYGALTTVSTTGTPYMRSLTLDNDPVLTSVTTAGQMDYFTLNNCDIITSINMGHNFVNNALGNGTTVIITNNISLATLTTSTSNMKELTVTGNGSLTTANFASYVVGQTITSGAITIAVHSNAMSGTYTPSIFATNTAPVMTQASLSTLKAYATDLLTNAVFTVTLDLGYTQVATESIALMDADRAAFILAGGSGLTTFVNRDTDPTGGVGTRIDVLRELGYLN